MQSPADTADNYARALELMQYEVQRLWIIFGTFLLAESVLLGGLASAFKDAPTQLVIGGSAVGFLLVIPWWTGFEYCRAFYLLRIDQAKRYEARDGFLTEGARLAEGERVGIRHIGIIVCFVRIQRGAWFLMTLFAGAFLGIALLKASSGS